MIEYLKGDLTELTPTTATIECHGVGYLTHISLYTYTAIQNRPHVKLYVHEAIRDDAYQLYGFVDKRERELFLQLISLLTMPKISMFIIFRLAKCFFVIIIKTINRWSLKVKRH